MYQDPRIIECQKNWIESQGWAGLVVFSLKLRISIILFCNCYPWRLKGAKTQASIIWNSWSVISFIHGDPCSLSVVVSLPKTVRKLPIKYVTLLQMGILRPREISECLSLHSWGEVTPTVGHGSAPFGSKDVCLPLRPKLGSFLWGQKVWVLRMPFLDMASDGLEGSAALGSSLPGEGEAMGPDSQAGTISAEQREERPCCWASFWGSTQTEVTLPDPASPRTSNTQDHDQIA